MSQIPITTAGSRLLVCNISNENLVLFSGVQVNAGAEVDLFVEDPTITEARALSDMENPLGSLYIETSINNRVRIIDFDTTGISVPDTVYGNNNKIVWQRDIAELESVPRLAPDFGTNFNTDPNASIQLWVSTSGDDETGDGSSSKPFATPQAAVDSIKPGSLGHFIINLSAGNFNLPHIRTSRLDEGGLVIALVGDRSAPTLTFDSAPSFATASGVNVYSEATVEAFSGVTTSSHWLEDDFSFYIPYASASLTSSSPVLEVLNSFHTAVALHPYSTTITAVGGNHTSPAVGNPSLEVGFSIIGCQFTGDHKSVPTGIDFSGCRLFTASNVTFVDCAAGSGEIGYSSANKQFQFFNPRRRNTAIGGLVTGNLVLGNGEFNLTSLLIRSTGNVFIGADSTANYTRTANCFLSNIDSEITSGVPILIDDGGIARGSFSGTLNISGGPTNAIHIRGGRLHVDTGYAITGSTDGDGLVLERDAQAIGWKSAASGLTSSGDDVALGSAGGVTKASLPGNDYNLTDSVNVRAS